MANILSDGSVIPSNFQTDSGPGALEQIQKNTVLQIGTVISIVYPESERSISKKMHEYDVAVTNMDRESGLNTSIYRNCRLSDRFAAPNNSEVYTLVPGEQDGKGGYKNGSVVVLECIGGNSDASMATIIGGMFSSNVVGYTEADGQVYEFLFNGVRQKINKDGEFILEFNSYIGIDGKKANEKAAGTAIAIDKNGNIRIFDNEGQYWELNRNSKTSTWSNGQESIVIDKEKKQINLTSSGEVNSNSDKDYNINSNSQTSISSKNDASLKSEANVNMESKANFQMKSGGNWQVQVTGNAIVKAGGNLMMEGGSQAQLKGTITMLGAGSVPVAAVGVSMVLGTGNLGIPVISQILTGSSTVLVGT